MKFYIKHRTCVIYGNKKSTTTRSVSTIGIPTRKNTKLVLNTCSSFNKRGLTTDLRSQIKYRAGSTVE